MAQSVAATQSTLVELISSYSASNQEFQAVAMAPAWRVIGAFYMPTKSDGVRLEAVALVSRVDIQLIVRLFDVLEAAPVSGSTTPVCDGTVDERIVSGAFAILGGRVYQYQAQIIGDISQSGIVRSAQLI